MKALITGATGFVGRRLVAKVPGSVVLTRDASRAKSVLGDVNAYPWDASREKPPAAAFQGVDTIFHLAGEPVAEGRWNAAKKQRLRDSRVFPTRNLIDAVGALGLRPKTLVCASAVGYYGDRGEELLDETSPAGSGFLADVCKSWEQEAARGRDVGMRVVSVRIGVVLGKNGGALKKMLTPFKLGVGGVLGNGKQWMPWIHLDDLVNLLLFAADHTELEGPINGVAPEPATNREFTKTLAATLHRPAIFPVPEFAVRLAFGEVADVLLASQRVIPKMAQERGFEYRFGRLGEALKDVVGS
jgi:uncharacterized protein (TIGR01777 family)